MKVRITKKELMRNYKCISVGYCALQNLLKYENPLFYVVGVNGWSADVYIIGYDVAIVTGYNPIGRVVDHSVVKKYDEAAVSFRGALDEKFALKKLCETFIKEVFDNNK